MSNNVKKHIKSALITLISLAAAFCISIVLHKVLAVDEHITTVFVFGVFVVSLLTEGYIYGLISAFIAVIAVNFAFTFPYFAFNFTIPQNFLSALVMIVISVVTSALVTKLKRWQEIKAEGEREKMRADLLRAVSHDLRTPLTTIYGSSSAILESYESLNDAQKLKMLSGIKEDSQWLISMVENLLSVTRLDGSHIDLIKTPTAVDELIDTVILKFKKRYPEKQLSIDLPEEIIIVPMDAMLIGQVIINILENAVQHATGMTEIKLAVKSDNNKAIFEISDNGCGIDSDCLKHIFSGYYSAGEPSPDSKKRNSGIGLSVCAAIINAHGGSIEAENRVGGGALFRFALEKEDCDDNE